ncbi:hypothetical protein [Poritiphilus flavus]|uniref:Uncharacterized protein n=1 Tax=Poritiphilus flavus TaxID=2697053 RepID=A0A6L9EC32_9FLAO|nr:hypothetical protein [Poritiphilus flavus]NAS12202.1 hypothetical protein [Poritiphilus flavus]
MKTLSNTWPRTWALRRFVFQTCLVLMGITFLSGCSAYRAERLKNKSYRQWKARQMNEESHSKDNVSNRSTYFGRTGRNSLGRTFSSSL